MAFLDNAAAMQVVIYDQLGMPASWTPPDGAASCPVTVIFDKPPASDDAGGRWDERPKAMPARRVRVRTSELADLGLMAVSTTTRAPAPVWKGATINFDGVERRILTEPAPADDMFRLEWVFDLD